MDKNNQPIGKKTILCTFSIWYKRLRMKIELFIHGNSNLIYTLLAIWTELKFIQRFCCCLIFWCLTMENCKARAFKEVIFSFLSLCDFQFYPFWRVLFDHRWCLKLFPGIVFQFQISPGIQLSARKFTMLIFASTQRHMIAIPEELRWKSTFLYLKIRFFLIHNLFAFFNAS